MSVCADERLKAIQESQRLWRLRKARTRRENGVLAHHRLREPYSLPIHVTTIPESRREGEWLFDTLRVAYDDGREALYEIHAPQI